MADNLGSHIAWCSTCILMVIVPHDPRNTEISNSKIPVRIKDKVFWLQVSMDNFTLVQILKADYNVGNKKFCFGLTKLAFTANMIS